MNLQEYFVKHNLIEFGRRSGNGGHLQGHIMQVVGEEIVKFIEDFKPPKRLKNLKSNPNFKICLPCKMKGGEELESFEMSNSRFKEKVYRIQNETLKFLKSLVS